MNKMRRLESLPASPAQCPSLPHLFRTVEGKIQTYTNSEQPIAYMTQPMNDVRRGKVYISILGNGRWELEESFKDCVFHVVKDMVGITW